MNALQPYLGMLKAAAVVAIALALVAFGYHSNHDAEKVQAKWDKETAARAEAENAAILGRIADNAKAKAAQDADKLKLKVQYENELSQVRAAADRDHAVGLRINASVCSGFASGTEASSASGSNAATSGTVALPDAVTSDLRALMVEADTVLASCRIAQQFIRDNGMAP